MSDRGMKKWNAYKALIEQNEYNRELSTTRKKIEKPILSEDQMESINEILTSYQGETLLVSVYKNGFVEEKEIIIKTIDVVEKRLILIDRKSIYFKDIVGLKRKNSFDF